MSWWTEASRDHFTAAAEARGFVTVNGLSRAQPGRPPSATGICTVCGDTVTGLIANKCGKCRRKAGRAPEPGERGARRPQAARPRGDRTQARSTTCARCEGALKSYEIKHGYLSCRVCLKAHPSGRVRRAPLKPRTTYTECQTCGRAFTPHLVSKGIKTCTKDTGCRRRSLRSAA